MRIVLLLALFLGCSAQTVIVKHKASATPPAFVSGAYADSGGSTVDHIVSSSIDTAAGNLVYVIVRIQNYSSVYTITVLDDTSNACTQIGGVITDPNLTISAYQLYCKNTPAKTGNHYTARFYLSGVLAASAFPSIAVAQFSGLSTSSPLDQSATGSTNSASSVTSSAFTTTSAPEVICSGVIQDQYTNASTPWTTGADNPPNVAYRIAAGSDGLYHVSAIEYSIVTGIQTSAHASWSISPNKAMAQGVATFKQ
jgi:hypothetical protein